MTSTHYRFIAEEIRTRSAEYICQDTRLEMQKVAEMWDHMAADKERWEAIEARILKENQTASL